MMLAFGRASELILESPAMVVVPSNKISMALERSVEEPLPTTNSVLVGSDKFERVCFNCQTPKAIVKMSSALVPYPDARTTFR